MNNSKTEQLLFIGIIGAFFAIASDFLIVYTDLKTALKLPWGYLGVDIANWRPTLSLLFAIISYVSYITAYKGVSVQLARTNKTVAKWFYRIILANALVWLFLHSTHCVSIYTYNALTHYDVSQKGEIIEEILGAYAPFAIFLFATNVIPLLLLFYQVVRGKTIFPKMFVFVNPVVISMFAIIPWLFMQESDFLHSVYFSGGNIGMLFFFVFATIFEKRSNI